MGGTVSTSELSPEQRDAIVTLHNQGQSYRKIGRMVGCTKDTARKHYKLWEAQQQREHARSLTVEKRLHLQTLESYLANQADALMEDQKEIDSITAVQLKKDTRAYTPITRASVRRSNMNALRETHTMISHAPTTEGDPAQLDMVGVLTDVMKQLADTPEKRRVVLEIIKKQKERDQAPDA